MDTTQNFHPGRIVKLLVRTTIATINTTTAVIILSSSPPPLPPSFSPPPLPSPPPPIGRGIEHANARSKYCYRNRCTHIIKEMENEIRCLPFTISYSSPVHSLQLSLQLLAFNYAGNILHVLYFTIFWFASGVCILQIFEDTLSAWRSSRCLWQLSMKEEPTTTNARTAWE